MRSRRWLGGCAVSLATAVLTAYPPNRLTAQSREVLLATTTSTRDAGLLDSLLPVFQRQTGYRVKVIAVGSGQALAMGRRGDADVVLSHAPEEERVLVDSGYFVRRRLVMHNDFLVVGPPADPAGLRGMSDAVAAFRRLAERPVVFVSRGDQSGTHQREQALWKRARLSVPPFGGSYVESGQGMGATLQLADEKHGYTLTDRATYLAWRDKLQLVPPGEVRRPVGERVAVLLVGELQRGAHALPRLDVRAPEGRHGQPRALPQGLLALVRAGLVAARDEHDGTLRQATERRDRVAHATQPRGVGRRADHEEVVVHHQPAADEIARVHEHTLRCGGMRQHDVGIAEPPHRERLPAANGNDLHAVAGLSLEHGEQGVKQAGVAS